MGTNPVASFKSQIANRAADCHLPFVICYLLLALCPLLFAIRILLPPVALAQGGPYQVVIEGTVTQANGSPMAYKPVILTTTAGEVIETQTDYRGQFRLEATVTGDGGTLEVKSSFSDRVSYGTVPLTWAAGGPGEKYLVVNATSDGSSLTVEGTEPPVSTEVPAAPVGPVETTPTPPPASAGTPVAAPTAPPETPAATGSIGVLPFLVCGGLVGLGLIVGGVVFLMRKSG